MGGTWRALVDGIITGVGVGMLVLALVAICAVVARRWFR